MDTNQKALQNDKPPIESLSIQKKQSQYVDQNLDNSFTRTGFSTRSDNNLDIPIIPPRDQDGFYSTHAIENYDECLMSVKNMENNIDGFFSSNAHEPEVGKYGAMDNNFVTFFSSQHGGLLVSTLFAELGSTCIKRVLLPLLQMELELEPYQVEAANTLILLPWSYTFVWGFLSDAVPLLGTRRKSYIIAGWVVSLLTNFAMAILNYTLEYNAVSRHAKTEETLKSHVAIINGYIGLLMLASFGGVLALVIAETYVVVQTRREPLKERGKALGTLLMTQFLGKLVGQIVSDKIIFHITKLGLTPIVSFRQTALFCMFCSLVPLFALVFFFHEDPDPPAINDEGTNCRPTESHEFISVESVATSCFQGLQLNWFRLRRALAKESTVDVIRFFMGFVFLSEFKLTYPHDQLELWCNFTEKAQSLSNIILGVLYILAVAVWKYYALSCNWRYGIWFSLLIIVMLPQVIFFYMAILSTSMRSQQAFMFMTALRGFLRGGLVILEAVLSAEIAPVGGEGAFLGIIISMGSIMRLLSTTFSNALAFMFEDPTIVATDQIRDQVAFGLGVCYFVKLISVVAVFSLPRQKQELQKLHRHSDTGDKSTTWWVLGSLGCAFFISAVFNLLAIIPSTTCFELFGGGGCS